MIQSNHKAEVFVFNGVSHIDWSMLLGSSFVICSVTFPHIISNDGHSLGYKLLEWPASSWLVVVHLIKEVSLENGVISLQILFLCWVLDVSEMRVELQVITLVGLESLECFISLHLVLRSQLHWSLRDDMAVILDCSHVIVESVNLLQVDSNNQGLWIHLFSGT